MNTIALASDFSQDEAPVVAVAAALAARAGARLVTIHASAGPEAVAPQSRVAELAAVWGRSIRHERLFHHTGDTVTDTLLEQLERVAPALVVTGTHRRGSWQQLFAGSVAEEIARNVRVPTLIVPVAGRPFVNERTGAVNLRRVLVPAGDVTTGVAGLNAAAWLANMAGMENMEIVLLHVEDGHNAPTLTDLPLGMRVVRKSVTGNLVEAIAREAITIDACAVVMATRGHDGIGDIALGSHTERVLRQLQCPLLSVPVVDG